MLCMVKIPLKGEVGGRALILNSHGNYIVDHGKSWNIMEISVGTLLKVHLKAMYIRELYCCFSSAWFIRTKT